MRFVIVESRFAGKTEAERRLYLEYAKACLFDCLRRGEAPFASHLLYPQVLKDDIPAEREWGMVAGFEVGKRADATVVYTDLGWSNGMERGVKASVEAGRPVEHRKLSTELLLHCRKLAGESP